jgi:hypothetical protein
MGQVINFKDTMTLEIEHRLAKISVFGNMSTMPVTRLDDYTVKIDGKECPPAMRDIILAGMLHLSGLSGKTFAQVVEEYTEHIK